MSHGTFKAFAQSSDEPSLCAYTVMPGEQAELQVAFVQVRLIRDEFDLRVGWYGSRAAEFLLHSGPLTAPGGMSDTGLIVSGVAEPPIRYDVTLTVALDGGCGPDPSEFAVAAGQAASSRNASVMSAHT